MLLADALSRLSPKEKNPTSIKEVPQVLKPSYRDEINIDNGIYS